MSDINSFIVYNLDNTMDLVKSIEACKSYMDEHKATEANADLNHEMIGTILHKVFDTYHGKRINERWLIGECLYRICYDTENSSHWCKHMRSELASRNFSNKNFAVIKSYLYLSTSKSEFVYNRGRWGRICDLSPEA